MNTRASRKAERSIDPNTTGEAPTAVGAVANPWHSAPVQTRKLSLAACAFLFLAVVWTFLPALHGDFVEYDDSFYVTANSHVNSGLTAGNVRWALGAMEFCNWHPVTWWSHMLDMEVYGTQAWGHHLTGILLHATSTVLVFLVFCRMTGAVWPSLLLAVLFGLHPMRVESVAWISERKDVLATLFWLLTLLCYVQFVQASPEAVKRRRGSYALALGCFALGLMSKPSVVTLPFALLLLDYWPLGRWKSRTWRALLVEKVPFFLLTFAACAVTYVAQKRGGVMEHLAGLSLGLRIENAVVSYVRYVSKLVLPIDLCALYPHPGSWPATTVLFASLTAGIISVAALAAARRHAWFLVGWLWFLGTLVPMIGFVQVGTQSMADRYSYIPSIGIFVVIVWGGFRSLRQIRPPVVLASAAGLALLCAALTRHQLTFWRDGVSVWSRAVAVTRENYDAQNRLGRALATEGRLPEAIQHFEEVVRLKPADVEGQCNLGKALALTGRSDEAIACFDKVVALQSDHVVALDNLGNLYLRKGQVERAIRYCERALMVDPDYGPSHNNLGLAYYLQGNLPAARLHCQRAVALDPNNWDARNNLGSIYLRTGEIDLAIAEFNRVLNSQPDSSEAHNNLGNALLAQGRSAEAVGEFRIALNHQPRSAEICRNLGRALEKQGDPGAAARCYENALIIRPDYPEAKADLARVQKAIGEATP